MKNITFLLLLTTLLACGQASDTANIKDNNTLDSVVVETAEIKTEIVKIDSSANDYAWLTDYQASAALVNNIQPPKGFTRVKTEAGSFANWLQFLPLQPSGAKVYYYNGEAKHTQSVHAAVVNIDVGKRDLQQCADAVMRLKAEYHYSLNDWEAIHFNFTSGDRVSFEDWRYGKKPVIKGNKVGFTAKGSTSNTSYANFKKYLVSIYSYAGTASLSKEMERVSMADMQIGDVFIQGGFPGHAVIVVDMAENEQGEKLFLIAQSYMPAQSIHILKNFHHDSDKYGVWYPLDFGNTLYTPEWEFTKNDLKRFEE